MFAKCRRLARSAVSIASSVALALSLCPFGQAFADELGEGRPSELTVSEARPAAEGAVYVGVPTSGEGDGSEGNPYRSLSYAIEKVDDGGTVCVSSDVELGSIVWIGKSVTIEGVGEGATPTISRGNDFATSTDGRGTYNPAMFEVYGGATVLFRNVTLDDCGIRKGDHLVQASSSGAGVTEVPVLRSDGVSTGDTITVDNDEIAQDAIVATYDEDCEIVLGDGAVLKNFGGMSAVRVAPGTLTMLDGSSIVDEAGASLDRSRVKQDPTKPSSKQYGHGVAGAVWIQGGAFRMEQGSSISSIRDARAVYLDGGSVEIGGVISDVSLSKQSWQGTDGALHVRNGGKATLETEGSITNVGGDSGFAVCVIGGTNDDGSANPGVFNMNEGSTIDVQGPKVGGISAKGNNGASLNLDGTITGVNGATVLHINVGSAVHPEKEPITAPTEVELGPNCLITGNHTDGIGILYMQTVGGKFDIKGRIEDNTGNGLWFCHNNGSSDVTMHDGATVRGNSFDGYTFKLSKCVFTMEGGSIDHNVNASTSGSAGISVVGGGVFVMNGGSIESNANAGMVGAVAFDSETSSIHNADAAVDKKSPNAFFYPRVELNGGTIADNVMGAVVTKQDESQPYTYEGGVPAGVSVSKRGDDATKGTFGSRYGQSGKQGYYDNHVTNLVDKTKDYYYRYSFEENDRGPKHVTIGDGVSIDAPSVLMSQGGFSIEGAEGDVKLNNAAHENEETAADALKNYGLTEVKGSFWYQTGYASREVTVAGLQFDDEKQLYAAIVATGEDGKPLGPSATLHSVEAESDGSFKLVLPGQSDTGYAVVFLQQAPESPAADVVTITPADITVYEGGDGYSAVVDDNGDAVTDGSMPYPLFKIDGVEDVDGLTLSSNTAKGLWTAVPVGDGYYRLEPGEGYDDVCVAYTNGVGKTVTSDEFDVGDVDETFARFSVGLYSGNDSAAGIAASKDGKQYAVALGTGTLTVRAVQSDEPESAVTSVAKDVPSEPLSGGKAMAVEPSGGTDYTLNDTGVKLPEDSKPSLLFDDIIEDEGSTARTEALKAKADESLGAIGAGESRNYEVKYLDLVDAKNSNAWIKSSKGMDVYWSYPEGTGEDTNFTLLHFKGLHRDGENSGFDVGDIDKSTVEEVDIEKTAAGLAFHVDEGGFSPFALVWTEDGGGSVTPPQPQTVMLHYETNGGRPLADEVHVVGSKVELKTPLREGCTFAGWYLDAELTKPAESPLAMDSNKTVWAKWESTSVPGGFASEHVNYVVGRKTDEGRLIEPESNITRAEVAAMFYRLLDDDVRDEYYRESSTFPDVEAGAWYEIPVATLQAMGIIRGDDPAGTCRPGDPITRAEFAAMAGRFDDDGEWPDMEPFADMDGHWAERIVLVAAKNGWVLGDEGSDKFRPDDPITRAEAITITNRVLQRIPESESDLLPGRVEWPDNQDKGKWYWLAVEEATNNHDHTLKGDGSHERWTALLKNEDWE